MTVEGRDEENPTKITRNLSSEGGKEARPVHDLTGRQTDRQTGRQTARQKQINRSTSIH